MSNRQNYCIYIIKSWDFNKKAIIIFICQILYLYFIIFLNKSLYNINLIITIKVFIKSEFFLYKSINY